jgi:hypothetical protein
MPAVRRCRIHRNVPLAVDSDAIRRHDDDQEMVVELQGVRGGEPADAQVPWQPCGGDLGVPVAVGADVVVTVEDQAQMVAE